MPTNPYISQNVRSEQNLYEDLVIESLKFYGQDVYYIPREIVNKDTIFLDDVPSRFTDAYKVEMYIENTEGWQGEGDLFTKFGIELRDQATFIVARRRWKNLIGNYLDSQKFRPREGDVIYLPLAKSIWQITKVETETPFYQLSQLPTFRLQCELFEYSDEDFDTGIDDVDVIEYEGAYQYALTMHPNDTTGSVAAATATIGTQGELSSLTFTHTGLGYDSDGRVEFSFSDFTTQTVKKFGVNSINMDIGRGIEGNDLKLISNNGFVEMFVKVDAYPTDKGSLFLIGGGQTDVTNQLMVGIGSAGGMYYSRGDNEGDSVQPLSGANLGLGSWNHIGVGVDSDRMYVFINGERSGNFTLPNTGDFISGSYSIGAVSARELDGVEWAGIKGYIDEIKISVGSENTVLADRYVDDSDTISVPTAAFDSDSLTSLLEHADGTKPTVTATVANGEIVDYTIVNGGFNYMSAPTVTISSPVSGENFEIGDTITQIFDTYTISGEVTRWSDSDRILQVAHVGSTDGKFHEFQADKRTASGSKSWVTSAISEVQAIQTSYQNTIFDNFEADFLDFSETNPFGDMR